jgi:DNA-binding phage protein
MKRKIVGARVAHELFAVETAVETTYGAMAQFAGLLANARTAANLSAVYGQDVMEDVNAAMTHLLQARRALVKAHGGLAEVRDQVGLRHIAFGVQDKPPMEETTGRLRVVGE